MCLVHMLAAARANCPLGKRSRRHMAGTMMHRSHFDTLTQDIASKRHCARLARGFLDCMPLVMLSQCCTRIHSGMGCTAPPMTSGCCAHSCLPRMAMLTTCRQGSTSQQGRVLAVLSLTSRRCRRGTNRSILAESATQYAGRCRRVPARKGMDSLHRCCPWAAARWYGLC